jgi:Family of unknown function (DUF5324)
VGLKSKSRLETAKERAESASHTLGHKVGPVVSSAKDKAKPYAEKAVERGATAASAAVDKVSPVVDEALHKVGPATTDAAEKARERFNDDVLPKISSVLTALAAAAEPVVEETSKRGKATKAALKGEIEAPKKTHRLRKVVIALGFGAMAAAAVKRFLTPKEPAWQSTPTAGASYGSSSTSPSTTRPRTGTDDKLPGTERVADQPGDKDIADKATAPTPPTPPTAPTAPTAPTGAADAKADEPKKAEGETLKKAADSSLGDAESKPAAKKSTARRRTGTTSNPSSNGSNSCVRSDASEGRDPL